MKSRPFPIIALLALAAGGVAIYLLNHLPASSARSAHLTSDRAVPRPREKRSPDPFGELDPRLHGIVERLENARDRWLAETPEARQFNRVLWSRAAMAALKDLSASDAKAILEWAEMHWEKAAIIGQFYLAPLHQRLAFLQPDECLSILHNEGLSLQYPSYDSVNQPWHGEVELFWHAYYLGLAARDPKEALDTYWKDVANESLKPLIESREVAVDLYAALTAADSQSGLERALSSTPQETGMMAAFSGFCRGAPAGQDWAGLAEKEFEIFGDTFSKAAIEKEIGERWLMEDPKAALAWYAHHQEPEEDYPTRQGSNANDPFGASKNTTTGSAESLIEELARDENIDPGSGAGFVLTKLIANGDAQNVELATAVLRELVRPSGDPIWFQALCTLPDDDARSGIFMNAVRQVSPRSNGDPFAPAPIDDGSPNPQVEALRPWIGKMRLSPENAAAAEAVLKSVGDQEAAARSGKENAKPNEDDPFAPPKQ